jgi:hypothetical protein
MLHRYGRLLAGVAVAAFLSQPATALAQAGGPDPVIAMSHTGNFTVGVNGVYTIVVSNVGGTASNGTVQVHDQFQGFQTSLPFTFVSAVGTGWSCSYFRGFPNEYLDCYGPSAIAPGGSAFPITLTVRPDSSGTVTNTAQLEYCAPVCTSVNSATDVTIVVAAVPTLPAWAVIALAALLTLGGFFAMRRRTT